MHRGYKYKSHAKVMQTEASFSACYGICTSHKGHLNIPQWPLFTEKSEIIRQRPQKGVSTSSSSSVSSPGEDASSLGEVTSSLGEASAAHRQRPALTRYCIMRNALFICSERFLLHLQLSFSLQTPENGGQPRGAFPVSEHCH